jgi:hypothetical protein
MEEWLNEWMKKRAECGMEKVVSKQNAIGNEVNCYLHFYILYLLFCGSAVNK